MKPSTQDRTAGKLHEVKGKIKEEIGKATNDPNLEVSGKRRKRMAKFRNGSAGPKRLSANKDVSTTSSRNSKENSMSPTVLEKTAEQIAQSAHQASRATPAVGDAIDDGVGVARRAAKQGGDAAEEFLNDTTHRIQRHPVLTVATTFAVGVAAGTLLGLMMKRK